MPVMRTPLCAGSLALALVFLVAGRLHAQQPDSTTCSDRLGPSMSTIAERLEPVFTDPFDPGRTVYRRLLELRFADSVSSERICEVLREFDLRLILTLRPGLPPDDSSRPLRILVLARMPSSLEELRIWRNAIAEAEGVVNVLLVPFTGPLIHRLGPRYESGGAGIQPCGGFSNRHTSIDTIPSGVGSSLTTLPARRQPLFS